MAYSLRKALWLIGALWMFAPAPRAHGQIIRIDGSSTVFPLTQAVSEKFQKIKKGALTVTVGITGTGGGFRKFCRGETDINDASRPILQFEMETCKRSNVQYIEIPVAFDALTVMVNPQNDWVRSFSVADLKKIWEPSAQSRITQWHQVRPEWPGNPLLLFGPGTDSGTFDYFTEAIVGKTKASRDDFTASEDDNALVRGIATNRNALGYFGFAYYVENKPKLKAVPIDAGKGAVAPSAKTVEDGTYQPLSRPIFIYVSKKSLDKSEVREYIDFYLKNAAELVKQVKYVPLPGRAYILSMDHVKRGKVGSVFRGEPEIGVKIEDLLKREAKF